MGVTVLTTDFKIRSITRDKEENFITAKKKNSQKDLTILFMHLVFKYLMTELQYNEVKIDRE